MEWAGLCHTDVHQVNCDWGSGGTFPIVPGHEIIGKISKVGSRVKSFKVGDKVGYGVFESFCGNCE